MTVASAVAEVLDELGFRHPAKPPHEQWMHAGKAKAVAKTAEKLLAALGAEPPRPTKAAKKVAKKVAKKTKVTPKTGNAALAAPPLDLAKMGDDPRAPALWYRTGDNSMELGELGFVLLNDHMRLGGFDSDMDARIADIHSAMRDSVLTEPIEVWRGLRATGFGEPGTLKGTEFTDKAFVSTTTDFVHATNFGSAIMRIRVPAGVSAIRMADRDPDMVESEILLDSDLRYRIVDEEIDYDDAGRINNHIINVEVIA